MSTIKVDTITDTSGNSIPYMKGSVLQVQYFQLTTSQTETTKKDSVTGDFIYEIVQDQTK